MAKRPITAELLNLAIESQIEAGVPSDKIRLLVEAYAGDDLEADIQEAIIGFRWVEDIPPSRRAEFLSAILTLSPEPKFAVSNARHADIRAGGFANAWLSKAKAVLRFASA